MNVKDHSQGVLVHIHAAEQKDQSFGTPTRQLINSRPEALRQEKLQLAANHHASKKQLPVQQIETPGNNFENDQNKVIQRIVNVGGDQLAGKSGTEKLLRQGFNMLPGTVNEIIEEIVELHIDQTTTYTNLAQVYMKVDEEMTEKYGFQVNSAAVDLRLANPGKTFMEDFEYHHVTVHKSLSDYGIRSLANLRKWFKDHYQELNTQVLNFYDRINRKTAEQFEIAADSLPEYLKVAEDRKGLCGQTSNMLLRYLAEKYPAIYQLGEIKKGTDEGGGTHEYLIFNYDDGHVLVDPTYKQFDTSHTLDDEEDIFVGTKGTHPFDDYTEQISDATIDLKVS